MTMCEKVAQLYLSTSGGQAIAPPILFESDITDACRYFSNPVKVILHVLANMFTSNYPNHI